MAKADAHARAKRIALVLSGGVGLGAYQAGAYAQLQEDKDRCPDWIAAASMGAINAAIIAGNPLEDRVRKLRAFWTTPDPTLAFAEAPWTGWHHTGNWLSLLRARLFGVPGQFRPRFVPDSRSFYSLYDLTPMRRRLQRLVDFGRLNAGDVRITIATTDIESGEPILFDTGKGARIELDHLLASCGFLPDFAPVEIGGRLLGDGAFAANAPIEPVLMEEDSGDELLCFVVDLFARDGTRPGDLESALARRWDLLFGNQTSQRLDLLPRERELRARLSRALHQLPDIARDSLPVARLMQDLPRRKEMVLYLSYRAPPEEAGPEKPFDFSANSVARRWQAGGLDMREALRRVADAEHDDELGLSICNIRRA